MAALALSASSVAVAQAGGAGAPAPTTSAGSEREPDAELHADPVASAVAIVPGVLLHGAGHYAAGKKQTAYDLLLAEGVGLGMVLVGGGTLALTGAARDLVGPAAAVTIAGVGLFGLSFLADIYGVAVPGSWRGEPLGRAYSTSRVGAAHVSDPQFDYAWFLTAGFEQWLGPLRVAPSAWFGLDSQNERLSLHLKPRFMGAVPGRPSADGSFLDADFGVTRHDFSDDGFVNTTLETSVLARLDLARVGPSLRGSFVEMGTGWGVTRTGYEVRGLDGELIDPDYTELLLFQMAFGGYFRAGIGEWRVYYDHRHDDFAAGLLVPGLGSGVAGHFGLDLDYFFKSRLLGDQLGVGVDAQVGAAHVLGLSVLFREAM